MSPRRGGAGSIRQARGLRLAPNREKRQDSANGQQLCQGTMSAREKTKEKTKKRIKLRIYISKKIYSVTFRPEGTAVYKHKNKNSINAVLIVFSGPPPNLVNVYQITGCKITVASFKITAPDRHSQQARPKWRVAANMASSGAASSSRNEAGRGELVSFSAS